MILSSCSCRVSDRAPVSPETARRRDPTQTGSIRAPLERELVRRVRRLRALLRQAIVEQDALGLRGSVAGMLTAHLMAAVHGSAANRQAALMQWFYEQARQQILGTRVDERPDQAALRSWLSPHLARAWEKGRADATARVRARRSLRAVRAGDARTPRGPLFSVLGGETSLDRLEVILTQAYRSLEGITDAIDLAVSRALGTALQQGLGAEATARLLGQEVEDVGVTRARLLARTETIRAHAEGALTSYEEAGVLGVGVEAEFVATDDDRVCPQCADLSGDVMSIDEARGLIPVHPNCRCTWIPVTE